ncbi:MAG: 4,5-dihydroxyphthalate decarboxylase [Actinophytocola sp.]|uniref:ABC transporter substrate-binding protein n=1 Tax=Actinophytocola sp. TaxID=1872138 RepID=UPI00132166A6|nr:ABC transporter substrate-binding protein [Actinophytocola sp.]MPZ86405.1 4,5-dihydroxyphthalate decarboxylase [Actinophytocola sp.]
MRRLKLSAALGDYDITRPILDGSVRPQGVDLVSTVAASPQRHWRMLKHAEFDVCEMSMGSYVARRSRRMDDLTAVPVFPHRRFRHGYLFVGRDSAVVDPADLVGGAIGLRSWQTTAGIWLRGILADHHGLPVRKVRWVAQDTEDVDLGLGQAIDLSTVEPGAEVPQLCADGDLDGLIYPELPSQLAGGGLRRVFTDTKRAEQDYFRETGIFPIMHVLVIRTALVQRHPWLARNLWEAFEQAKQAAMARLRNPRTVSLAWLTTLQEEERGILGPDPWEYGLTERNRTVIATFLRYAYDQGVAASELAPDNLFPDSVTEDPPAYV